MDSQHFFNRAAEIAEAGAAVANSYFRKALLIETKADASPVTIADRNAEETIREKLRAEFPDHGIFGEEFGKEREDAEFVWTIDPIDGTRSFVRGIPLWGTLLGLLHKGQPIVGAMVLPAIGETYVAAKGEGCYCNGRRVHVSSVKKLNEAFIAFGDRMAFEATGKLKFLESVVSKAELSRGYSDCFGYSLLVRSAVDVMIDPGVAPWDIVPVAPMVEEAGGKWFSFEDKPFTEITSFVGYTPALEAELKRCLMG